MNRLKIAICQILALDGDRAGNFERIESALRQASRADAQIACFPETALLGWVNSDAHDCACPIPGADTDRLAELARKYDTCICIGLAEKDADKLYDSAVLIDNHGEILLKHRKINLLKELMTPPYTPGEDVAVAHTPLGRIALLICADTFQDDLLAKTAALKPDILLVPYGWAAPEQQWPDHGKEMAKVVTNAAGKLKTPVIATNLTGIITHGPWTGRIYGGQSLACDEKANIITTLADRDSETKTITISH